MEEFGGREVYEIVLLIATLPALAFVIWLAWMITNRLMSPEWQQKRRSAQIRKARAEREALMAELHAADSQPKKD
jgi:hypothetical protein